jgi:hypothetical protein
MTDHQPYDTIRSDPAFELRRYPEHVLAETDVAGDFESAGSRAFRYLFGYITGENTASQSIAMTAPVVQGTSQRIAMTAPVVQTESHGTFTVAFVLPAGMSEASAPLPTRREVVLRTVPPRVVAAARFTGRWSHGSYEKHRSELLAAVVDAGLTPMGDAWFARFDPPYTPWFLRHNEVLVEVASTT